MENCRIMERKLEFTSWKTNRKPWILRSENASKCSKNAAFCNVHRSFSSRVNATFFAVIRVYFVQRSTKTPFALHDFRRHCRLSLSFYCVHQRNLRISTTLSILRKYAQKALCTKPPLSRGVTGKTFTYAEDRKKIIITPNKCHPLSDWDCHTAPQQLKNRAFHIRLAAKWLVHLYYRLR